MLNHFRRFTRTCLFTALTAISSIALINSAHAQSDAAPYPNHSLTLIVPFGAGSTPDQVARLVAAQAAKTLSQTIIVVNKPGAGGNIGTRAIAQAKPDGYTFGISINGPLVYNQFIFKTLGYDPEKDLAPLTLAVTQPNVIVVPTSQNINTLKELVNAIKANPDEFNFAIPGTGSGSHLSQELLLQAIGAKAQAIPYSSSPAAVNSILGNETHFTALAPIAVMPLVADGRLKALAQTSEQRNSSLSSIPTVKETGVADITSAAWNGFVISSQVPHDKRTILQKALFQALQDPTVVRNLKVLYMDPIPSTPEQFSAYMKEEKQRWEPLIKGLNLQKD